MEHRRNSIFISKEAKIVDSKERAQIKNPTTRWKSAATAVSAARLFVLGDVNITSDRDVKQDDFAGEGTNETATQKEVASEPSLVSCSNQSLKEALFLDNKEITQVKTPTKRWKSAATAISAARVIVGNERRFEMGGRSALSLHQEASLRDIFNAFDQSKAQHITTEDFGVILDTFLDRALSPEERYPLLKFAHGIVDDRTVDISGKALSFPTFKSIMGHAVQTYYESTPQDPKTAWLSVGEVQKCIDKITTGI